MRLSDLIAGLDARLIAGEGSVSIQGVTEDSREVKPGWLFIARRGVRADGVSFLDSAIRAGAAAVLVEPGATTESGRSIAVLESSDAADAGARLLERFAGEPSSLLAVVGVTGTNGKTTTCFLLHSILNAAGMKAGLVSTVTIDDGRERAKAEMTTPPAARVTGALARAVANGCNAAVVETSSHALHQRRVAGVRYRVGVFTNLTGDHLDYHKTMEEYAAAKATLFERLPSATEGGAAVVNADDPWSERMLRDCRARVFACSDGSGALRGGGATWTRFGVRAGAPSRGGMPVVITGPWGEMRITLPLVGRHNAMNALQAAAAAHALGAPAEAIARALERAPSPPGRLEPVGSRGGDAPCLVLVDYAHTDDALGRALDAARPLVAPGARLVCVFGCGGDKDRTKRPRMGRIVAEKADAVFVTSDNPRTEEPMSIIGMILEGMSPPQRSAARVDPDRERAIFAAIHDAAEGDVIVIAGKGHEDYQILPDGRGGTIRRDFDDRLVAQEALTARFGPAPRRPTPIGGAA